MRNANTMRRLFVLVSAAAVLLGLCGCGTQGQTASPAATGTRGAELVAASIQVVQQRLDALDADLADAADELATVGLTGAAADGVLKSLVEAHPEVVEFWTQNNDNRIAAIAPADYTSFVGQQGLPKDDAKRFSSQAQPLLTGTESAEEGFAAVTLIHPVASGGEMHGGVAAFINTDEFLGGLIGPIAKDAKLDKMWAMDLKGNNLYDPDEFHVGLNFYEDPLYDAYPEFVTLTKTMCVEPSGTGSYKFAAVGNREVIEKECTWGTVGLFGTEWRVAASMVGDEDGQ